MGSEPHTPEADRQARSTGGVDQPAADDFVDPSGPDPEGIADPMPDTLPEPPPAGEATGRVDGMDPGEEAPSG